MTNLSYYCNVNNGKNKSYHLLILTYQALSQVGRQVLSSPVPHFVGEEPEVWCTFLLPFSW